MRAMPRRPAPESSERREALPELLTTREVAERLRLNEKKVYALVQAERLPATRVSGKWLFPRALLDRWLAEHTVYPPHGLMAAMLDELVVMQGSDDWLLGHVLARERLRRAGPVVTATVGSMAGLEAVSRGQAHLAGFHVADAELAPLVPAGESWYALHLGTREQGLVFPRRLRRTVRGLASVAEHGLRFADRQPAAGTHRLTRRLAREAGLGPRAIRTVGPYSTHLEVALAVRAGQADVGMAIRIAAELCGLDFLSLDHETFKLAVPGGYLGHARLASWLDALLGELGASAREGVAGYSFETLGRLAPVRARQDTVRS
jgi:putative molybdopterin biosynthesis protein